jgi:serine/threonine-protein kinase
MSRDVQLGEVLDERFHVTDVIARSTMTTLFKATDLKTGQVVALKVPFLHCESDPSFFARFEREEAIAKSLDHPYILKIIPVDQPKSRPYIPMEYLEGQTLARRLHEVCPLPVADAVGIAVRIAQALEYLHTHDVVHRDLKPDNVMLCTDGSIRLLDFGIAKAAGKRRLTFTHLSSAMGTPDYMAPEQVRGKRGDPRTDIYSLGAILYEMVTGATPFEGDNPYVVMNARVVGDPVAPRQRNDQVPPWLEEIILHAMERNPADRYPTVSALRAELGAPATVTLTGRHERLQPPSVWKIRMRVLPLVLLALLIPLSAIGLIVWAVLRHRSQP